VFPIVNAVWSDNGVPVLRPEITTDQNFQIFYLFPIVLVLTLNFRLVRSSLVIAGMVGVLYILAKIQTRSGFIVFCGVALLALLAPLWTRSLGRGKTVMIPILLTVAFMLNHDLIMQVGDHLIARFTERTGAGLGKEMGQDRLESSLFAIHHLLDPEWWIPRGSQEFVSRYGFLPHSTMTAVYLEGGIVGLLMWLTVFIFPLLALGWLLLKRRLDVLATLVLIGGVASVAIQMSLHVPFLKHTWLWAGAVLGSLIRMRSQAQRKHEVVSDEQANSPCPESPRVRYASRPANRQ
jgi:O-antigen ligase